MVRPGVALLDGTTVLGVEDIDPTKRHDDELLPAIDRLTRAVSVRPADLARVAVSAGPGGFTAVRMAVTVAKTLADAAKIQCIMVPSAVVAAAGATGMGRTPRTVHGSFVVALASKGETAWIMECDGGDLWKSPSRQHGGLMSASDLPALASRGVKSLVADRFLPQDMATAAQHAGMAIVRPVFDAVACGIISLQMPATDPVAASPVYPRPPEAVRKWEEFKAKKRATGAGPAK